MNFNRTRNYLLNIKVVEACENLGPLSSGRALVDEVHQLIKVEHRKMLEKESESKFNQNQYPRTFAEFKSYINYSCAKDIEHATYARILLMRRKWVSSNQQAIEFLQRHSIPVPPDRRTYSGQPGRDMSRLWRMTL